MTPDPHFDQAVQWTRSGDYEVPYYATVGGHRWEVVVGDFPAEPLYTLLIDGRRVAETNTWPGAWERP